MQRKTTFLIPFKKEKTLSSIAPTAPNGLSARYQRLMLKPAVKLPRSLNMHRLRIFAGPNGSGKSSLYQKLQGHCNLGQYLNPDELYQQINQTRKLDLNSFGIAPKQSDWSRFWKSHGLAKKAPLLQGSEIENNNLTFTRKPKSYEASILLIYGAIRQNLT